MSTAVKKLSKEEINPLVVECCCLNRLSSSEKGAFVDRLVNFTIDAKRLVSEILDEWVDLGLIARKDAESAQAAMAFDAKTHPHDQQEKLNRTLLAGILTSIRTDVIEETLSAVFRLLCSNKKPARRAFY
jgi:hypothetical protein